MLRKTVALAILSGSLFAIGAQQANALWFEMHITPKGLGGGDYNFQITSKEVEGQEGFEVIVAPAKGKMLSPFTSASLFIANAETTVGTIPLQEKRKDGKITYTFRISPKFLSNSRFELSASGYSVLQGKNPAPNIFDTNGKYIQTMGGQAFYFLLSDFVPAPKP